MAKVFTVAVEVKGVRDRMQVSLLDSWIDDYSLSKL